MQVGASGLLLLELVRNAACFSSGLDFFPRPVCSPRHAELWRRQQILLTVRVDCLAAHAEELSYIVSVQPVSVCFLWGNAIFDILCEPIQLFGNNLSHQLPERT